MEWLRMKNDGRIWGCLSKIGGSSAAAVRSSVRRRHTAARGAARCGSRVQWQRHFSLDDGIDGLSSDDHQLETIILRTNLLTAVHCTSRPAVWAVSNALLVAHTSAIRGRMIELASYIGTINWRWKMDVSLAISCKLGIRPITLLG